MARKKKVPRVRIKKSERPQPPIHVGHLVWRHMNKHKQPRALLATATNRSLTTIVRQLRKPSMQIAELYEFCEVLKFNFFDELAAKVPVEYSATATEAATRQAAMEEEISRLLLENETLKQENKKLNDRVDLLIKKL